ncbi:MAG TPA: sporulation protein YqfD [Verrucomicrobiae bacterium]|nr:sporulation protein YqfD [Verrucomicrobiae bacterium]
MLLDRLRESLTGVLTVVGDGGHLEGFINGIREKGIVLWEVRRVQPTVIRFKIQPEFYNLLRPIVRATGVKVRIIKRSGLPFFWRRLKKRKGIMAGVACCGLILYALSSYVWFIDVKGNAKVNTLQILKAADEAGLKRGMWRKQVNTGKAAREIKEKVPQAAWVGVSVQGTRVLVEIVEKVEKPPAKPGKGALLAAKTGLISDVMVIKGTPQVKEGQTVKKGQVLIGADSFPAAQGFVRARVWYTGVGIAKVVEEGVEPTDNTSTSLRIKIGTKVIILTGKKSPFALFKEEVKVNSLPQWRNMTIPVEVITVTYQEMQSYKHTITREEALKLAEERARADLKSKLPPDVKILKEKTTLEPVKDSNTIRVHIDVETLEEIAVHQEN